MNQILSTENNDNKQKKGKKNDLLDMRKIIIIFSIIIIVFAVVIIGAKIFGIIKENRKNEETPVEILNKPVIEITTIDKQCRIEINYDEGLDKISYWWNDETVIEKNMNGSTNPFITTIEIPTGESNILTIKATGIDGSVNEKQQEFVHQTSVDDPNKPKITWYHHEGTNKMDIIASSDKGIKNITYNWEEEEEIIIDNTEQNQKEFKTTIDIKRGTNKLYIKATDQEGNTQTKEGTLIGVLNPEISVILENYRLLKINIIHDMGFKKVIIKVNDNQVIYDENNPVYSVQTTDLYTDLEVPPGRLEVDIKVYTLEEPEKEYAYAGSTEIP